MSKFSRRQLLIFFGSSAATTVLAPTLGHRMFGGSDPSIAEAASLKVTPVRLPHPLPIYQETKSYLPTAVNRGTVLNPSQNTKLTSYTVLDDVVVAPEYDRYVIVRWGDRVFPNPEDYFGYNCDYTGYIPNDGSLDRYSYASPNSKDGYLWVNHEYNSYPISGRAPETDAALAAFPESGPLVIPGFPKAAEVPSPLGTGPASKAGLNPKETELFGEFHYNMGGSIVRIRKGNDDRFRVVRDSKNRRIHGLSGLGINSERTDAYKTVTSWGPKSYQQGDQNYLIGTGPAATQVFNLSVDGLGNRIIGTAFNCSGGTTPWGTILSAEENFQAGVPFYVGVTEGVKPDGTQTGYGAGTTGERFGLVGEKYGWMVEVDVKDPSFRARKHSWLGRFRHENIALRVEPGKKLVGYMGDDRRGGHTWKFVSAGTVTSPTSKENSALFERGILYVAKFNPNGTGEWIPLLLSTDTNPIPPSVLTSVEFAESGLRTRNGATFLPRRNGIAGQTVDGGFFSVTTVNEATALPGYQGKKLSDFYTSQGAILSDAFPAANLVGGTPTARPEDLEVNPRNPREVFIAYTDGAPGSDGYPDSRIFVVSKYTRAVNDAQPSGELFKIIEDSADSTGLTFRWERLAKGGEAGAEIGDGFANVDNLAFDPDGNIWGVTDMSTGAHNGFTTGANPQPLSIDHTVRGNVAENIGSNLNVQTSNLIGVFGNNFLFAIPLNGAHAGAIVPVAYGPPRCEMTGPTFIGSTLIIAVQHPGEESRFDQVVNLNRNIEMLDLDGSLFVQNRTIPSGSNWPSNIEGKRNGPPRPSVIGIRPKQGNKLI